MAIPAIFCHVPARLCLFCHKMPDSEQKVAKSPRKNVFGGQINPLQNINKKLVGITE